MKALQIIKPYEFRIVEIPKPEPEEDDAGSGPMLYMEYMRRKANNMVPINKKILPEEAAVLELFGCVPHFVEIAGKMKNKKVSLSGLDSAGLAILQLLKLKSPAEIIGVENIG